MMKLCSPLTALNQLCFIQGCEGLMEIEKAAKGAGIISVLEGEVSGLIRN